jgi:peptidoglycan hydrolase CwlO-like protein
MPDELDEIRQRLTTLEDRVSTESGLRAMMDADQARLTQRFDAQDKLLKALSATQSDHTAFLRKLDAGQQKLVVAHHALAQNQVAMAQDFNALAAKVEGLDAKVEGLDGKVDALDGKVDTQGGRIDGLTQRMGNLETGVQRIIDILQQGR